MRISHSELEFCVREPRRWLVQTLNATSHPYHLGYKRSVVLTIYHFHKTNSPELARKHLQEIIDRHKFKDDARVDEMQVQLESYLRWVDRSHAIVADSNVRIKVDAGFLTVGGEVGRVDVTPTAYRAILLGEPLPDWKRQFRMPIIQRAVAMKYGRPVEEVEVGVQELDGSGLESISFSKAVLSRAEQRLNELGLDLKKMAGVLPKRP